ncbi:MAG TPA: PLD nuclease N-terminal domain-containing protein [Ktedonobacteraceae bacterium]
MDLFMQVVRSLDSSPLSLIWVVLLIDCFVNTDLKGPQKLWWILFILITQFFGALLYFFLGPAQIYRHIVNKMNQQSQSSEDNLKNQQASQQWYQQTLQRIYAQPTPSPEGQRRTQEGTAAYGQGYRAQERVTPLATQQPGPSDALYEEPQATYPEMTQEHKQQQ